MSLPAAEPIAPISQINPSELFNPEPAPTPQPPAPAAPAAPAAPSEPAAPRGASLDALFGKPPEPPAPPAAPDPNNPNPPEPPAEEGDIPVPAKLRAELARQKKEHREEQDRQREEYERLRADYEEQQNQFDLFRREVSLTDPRLAPEVINASQNLDDQITKASKVMPPTVARTFLKNAKSLIDAYGQLGDINDPEYDKRHGELTARMNREFGQHSDEVMKSLPTLEDMANKVKDAVRSASSNSGDVIKTRTLKSHQESLQMFTQSLEGSLTYSDELAEVDPFSPRNIIAAYIKQSPEFQQTSKKLNDFLKVGLVIPAPLSSEIEATMTPEQRQAAIQNQGQNFTHASQQIYQNTALAFHALAALPIITEMYAKTKAQLEAHIGASPSESRLAGADKNPAPSEAPELPINGVRPITLSELRQ